MDVIHKEEDFECDMGMDWEASAGVSV